MRWVGGKRQLLPVLRRYYPASYGAYHEPFVGSGAVFFDLLANGHLEGRPVMLSDDNADLIDRCKNDLPAWWAGKPGSDVKGIEDRIREKWADFEKIGA